MAGGERPGVTGWFVVMTQPNKEGLARTNLERQGFEVFLPMVRRTVSHARRKQQVLRPLFPRYAFLALDLERHRWRSVFGTFGVSTLIMEGERPRRVQEGIVETLQAASAPGRGVDFKSQLAVGQQVRFVAGPFAEKLGRLVEMNDQERVAVLLEILGAERTVQAKASDLAPHGG